MACGAKGDVVSVFVDVSEGLVELASVRLVGKNDVDCFGCVERLPSSFTSDVGDIIFGVDDVGKIEGWLVVVSGGEGAMSVLIVEPCLLAYV